MKRFKNEQANKMAATIKHEFKAEASGNTTEITIYGDIGESWWGESISANDIKNALKDVTTDTITIRLNSPGGDAFDGIAIYNQLKNHSAKVIAHIDGLAASAASIIAMAADEIIMNTGSMLMIHEASTFTWGTKADIKKTLNALEGIDASIADIYMTRFSGERDELNTLVENETWFTASGAVEAGLADTVNDNKTDDNIENLKTMIFNLQSEITQLKNKQPQEPATDPVQPRRNLSMLFLNL
ncbi:head maturation protease, ClpP-related [Bacillus sp. UNC438CL73TsuS30]|uniref:head maturation protease, ClpP-related n=1 Tax=Bacillus sp. UNC438CL73TsuS30 TaxID=1340434 RepID=UPI0004787B7C|nr:head maturation protease, ClpP-related [Bacillus sp. UNC438CL73TsuS30]